ncbi:MAG: protein kinase [Gemmatimonadota bacterium]|jgi:serine/threonine-protein kinase
MPDLLGRLQRALADRYAVASEIGRGGMATVFLAEDLRHRRKVAIKVLHPELAAAVGPERFLREIETVASLNHPHVLPLHDSGEADGLLFFVMPFVEGASLRQRLDAETQLPVDEAVRIAIEVCDGLDYAHRSGVVHRDVKPGNVLLSEGHAVITDFGIARALSGGRDRDATQAGLGVGTPSYASPEQASGTETLDGRADIYSLGCVLYEMLAGSPPLMGVTPQQIQARRLAETPSPLTVLRDTVPPLVDQAIARALARVPADRYRTAGEFADALRAATPATSPSGAFAQAVPAAVARAPGQRIAWLLRAAAAVGAVAVLLIALSYLGPPEGTDSAAGGREITERQLTATGQVTDAAPSPDGDLVAFCSREDQGYRLSIRPTVPDGLATDLAILEHCGRVRWMPDGQNLLVYGRMKGERGLYRVSRQGGSPVQVSGLGTEVFALSPDGSRFASTTRTGRGFSVRTFGESPQESQLSIELAGDFNWILDADWSPEGDILAVSTRRSGSSAIWTVDLETADQREVVIEAGAVSRVRWGPAGTSIFYLRESINGTDLMRIDDPLTTSEGSGRELIGSLGMATGFGLASSGSVFAIRLQPRSTFVAVAPDSLVGAKGSTQRALAEVPQVVVSLTGSPDGREIQYVGWSETGRDMYTVSLDGGAPRRVTHIGDVRFADWSPDGRFLAYSAPDGDTMRVWIISRHGGSPALLEDVEVSATGMLAWESGRLYYQHADNRNMGILRGLEILTDGGWLSLEQSSDHPDTRRRRLRATSDTPLVENDSVGWMFGPFTTALTEDVLVEWNRRPARGTWHISAATGVQTQLSGRGWPLDWTDDASGVYWQIQEEFYARSLDGGAMRLLLTLPDRLDGCGHPSGAHEAVFVCFEREDNANVWVIEGLLP